MYYLYPIEESANPYEQSMREESEHMLTLHREKLSRKSIPVRWEKTLTDKPRLRYMSKKP